MAKDPAAMLYIDKWLTSTKEMKACTRGWYLNLVLHQYDKGSLPNNVEELANMADVRFSEYELFMSEWECVLSSKFMENEKGRLVNNTAHRLLESRNRFKEQRSKSGKIGAIIKYCKNTLLLSGAKLEFLKNQLYLLEKDELESINEANRKQMLKQMLKLYINVNTNIDKDLNNKEKVSFAENVSMTNEEYSSLIKKYGEPMAKKFIERINNYKGSKGKTYKSDYRAILSWVVDSVKEKEIPEKSFTTNRPS